MDYSQSGDYEDADVRHLGLQVFGQLLFQLLNEFECRCGWGGVGVSGLEIIGTADLDEAFGSQAELLRIGAGILGRV